MAALLEYLLQKINYIKEIFVNFAYENYNEKEREYNGKYVYTF